jgi:hypothetical protein
MQGLPLQTAASNRDRRPRAEDVRASRNTLRMTSSTKISVGPASTVGWVVEGLAFAAAGAAFLTGDHSTATQMGPALLGTGIVSHVTTATGRYLQAHAQVKVDLLAGLKALDGALPSLEQEIEQQPPDEVTPPASALSSVPPPAAPVA